MSTNKERRKWALELAAALLDSDLDSCDLDEFDEAEQVKRMKAARKIAADLREKARKVQ